MSENTKLHRNWSLTHSQTTLGIQGISLMQRMQFLKRRQTLFWLDLGYPRLSLYSYLYEQLVFTKESNSCQYYIVHITVTITTTILVVEIVLVSFLVFHKISQISSCISHDAVIHIILQHTYADSHTSYDPASM